MLHDTATVTVSCVDGRGLGAWTGAWVGRGVGWEGDSVGDNDGSGVTVGCGVGLNGFLHEREPTLANSPLLQGMQVA